MTESLYMRDVPDWTEKLNRHDTPLLGMVGPEVKVGEQDRYGRTLLGYTVVDEARIAELMASRAEFMAELEEAYTEGRFERYMVYTDDEYGGEVAVEEAWRPVETEETKALNEAISSLSTELYTLGRPEKIWDRELTADDMPKKATWGWANDFTPLDTVSVSLVTKDGTLEWGFHGTVEHPGTASAGSGGEGVDERAGGGAPGAVAGHDTEHADGDFPETGGPEPGRGSGDAGEGGNRE